MMPSVKQINPMLARIRAPQALKSFVAWLTWKAQWSEQEQRWRKVPYYADGGRREGEQGTQDDRKRLATFDEAIKAAVRRGHSGVGFALMPEMGITALDFDDCVADGQVREDVLDLIGETYAELSPSGTGVRAFVLGKLADGKSHKAKGFEYGFETFTDKGFVTFTGAILPHLELAGVDDTVAPATQAVVQLHAQRIGSKASGNAGKLGLTVDQVKRLLQATPVPPDRERWTRVLAAVALELDGSAEGARLVDQWSSTDPIPGNYPGSRVVTRTYESFRRTGGLVSNGQVLLEAAGETGEEIQRELVVAMFEDLGDQEDEEGERPGETSDPIPLDWDDIPLQPVEPPMVVPGWMADNTVTLFSAHGGTGKSFLSLYIAICMALGRHPFRKGEAMEPVRVVLYSAEDDTIVMHGRLRRYMEMMGVQASDLKGRLLILDATASDNVLYRADERGRASTTKRYQWLAKVIEDFGGQVLVFDTAADAYDANENDRAKVRQFMSSLKRLAGAVLLLSHVDAVSSRSKGDEAKGYSGSTAWHNSARSRWFMYRDEEHDEIVLVLPKLNYGRAGSEAIIKWSDDHKVFELTEAREGRLKMSDMRQDLLALVMEKLDEGAIVRPQHNSKASLAKMLEAWGKTPHRMTPKQIQGELEEWLSLGFVSAIPCKDSSRNDTFRLEMTEKGRIFATLRAQEDA